MEIRRGIRLELDATDERNGNGGVLSRRFILPGTSIVRRVDRGGFHETEREGHSDDRAGRNQKLRRADERRRTLAARPPVSDVWIRWRRQIDLDRPLAS